MWIMVAGPYRSGAATAEARARNLTALNQAALALFRAGHVPVIGVNLALPLIQAAGGPPTTISYSALVEPRERRRRLPR